MMKIKNIVSQVSELEPRGLIERILLQLGKQNYIVFNKNLNTVSFKDDNWQIRPKGIIFSKVDEGKFETIVLDRGTRIELTYYISILPGLIISSIIVIVSITQSNIALFIALPLWIQLVVRIVMLKTAMKQLLMEIAS